MWSTPRRWPRSPTPHAGTVRSGRWRTSSGFHRAWPTRRRSCASIWRPTLVADIFEHLLQPGSVGVFVSSVAGHDLDPGPATTAGLDDPLAPGFPATVVEGLGGAHA